MRCVNTQRIFAIYPHETWRLRQIREKRGIYLAQTALKTPLNNAEDPLFEHPTTFWNLFAKDLEVPSNHRTKVASSTSGSENAVEHRGRPTVQQTSGRPISHNCLGTCLNKKMVAWTRHNKVNHVFHNVFQEPVPRIWSISWAVDSLGSAWQRKTWRPASQHNL